MKLGKNGIVINPEDLPQKIFKTLIKVQLIESERGWGQKIEDTLYFEDYSKAVEFVEEFNSKNDEPEVPDWYMYARIV